MNLDLGYVALLVIGYLALLFGIAYSTEKRLIPEKITQHPAVYVLSLGVYASAWALYGSVGFANQYGYSFLFYYLGISGAFLLAPILLTPLLGIIKSNQLNSLADLFSFRYRSATAGILTAILLLTGLLPLLALQIQAVTDIVHIVTLGVSSKQVPAQFTQDQLAGFFCLLIIVFTLLFGARRSSQKESHQGLITAIAFNSLVKLFAFGFIGLVVVFQVFDGIDSIDQWATQHPDLSSSLHYPLQQYSSRILLLVFFSAAVVMPHMFQMTFTENSNPAAMKSASWGFPLYLLLMSLPVLPILWSGNIVNITTQPEYYTLGLGMALQSPSLIIAALIAGIAAASGLMIATTLALSSICLNHLVLPYYQPANRDNLYRWILSARRWLIGLIILAAYGLHSQLSGLQDLSNLSLVAFIATLQLLPGLLGVLYWPAANRSGFISGLIVGYGIWFVGMLLPLIADLQGVSLSFSNLNLQFDENTWELTAVTSLSLNILVFALVSSITRARPEEKNAAEVCSVDNIRKPQRRELTLDSPDRFIEQLAVALGEKSAIKEVYQAMRELEINIDERRPYALRRLRDQIEINLSGRVGNTMARSMVSRALPYKDSGQEYDNEDIHFIENRLEDFKNDLTGLTAELDNLRRYHRQTLWTLPIGVCSLGADQEILMWNKAMESMTGISSSDVIGSDLKALDEPWRGVLLDFLEDPDTHRPQQKIPFEEGNRWVSLHKSNIAEYASNEVGGLVLLLEERTATRNLEQQLLHNERLASIGRFAAGIAHEIGNPVTGIACLAQNLDSEFDDPEVQDATRQILSQTRRITDTVQTLVGYAHGGHYQNTRKLKPVNLFLCVQKAMDLLQLSEKNTGIALVNHCLPNSSTPGNATQLQQVFVNLLSNALSVSRPGDKIEVRQFIS
ncbi:MAG: PAS domain-containing protein, partial [Pseudomonadales bacterium]|nr:PAS domain-containing protein [Pseudomonadales bacterium]